MLGSPVRRRLAGVELAPPLQFACRIEALSEGCSTIDNNLYSDDQYVRSWHSEDTSSKELATLALLNSERFFAAKVVRPDSPPDSQACSQACVSYMNWFFLSASVVNPPCPEACSTTEARVRACARLVSRARVYVMRGVDIAVIALLRVAKPFSCGLGCA